MTVSNVTAQPRQVRFIGQTGTTILTPETLAAVREEDLAEAQDDARYQAALSEGWPVSSFAPSVTLRTNPSLDGIETTSAASRVESPVGGIYKGQLGGLGIRRRLPKNDEFEKWLKMNADSLRLMMWLIIAASLIALVLSYDLPLRGGFLGR